MMTGAMWQTIGTVASAFGLVFLAELGDKTQLLAVGFGARYPMRTVMIGLTLGFASAGAIAAVVGGVLGATLPEKPIAIAGGLLFLGFALMSVIGALRNGEGTDDTADHVVHVRNVIASIALTIAIGELGDKTQLTTATLASQSNPVAVWIGATVGEVLAASIGAYFGSRVGARLNPKAVKFTSAALFALFGVLLLLSA
jgi:putative Ca2+/H+ antiporter (TMEM165/GDT1 family)